MKCIHCGTTRYHKPDMTQDYKGDYVCPECLVKYYKTCSRCGNVFYDDRLGKTQCDKCESLIYKNDMNNYSTKPFPMFKNFNGKDGVDMGCRYYGLEMEFNNTNAKTLKEKINNLYNKRFLYNKSDSSISRGVEVVTSPLDKKSLTKLLDDMKDGFKYVKEGRYKDNAGLHIHVNKKSIDVIDRYKLSILLNTFSSQKENAIIYYLAGRSEDVKDITHNEGYCKVGSVNYLSYAKYSLDRHIALNVRNKFTFEFRIFKSSADKDVILSYVEMVDTMIDFCHNNGINDINISNYILYLKSNCKNRILLKRIKEFEKANKEFVSSKNIIHTKELYGFIKGIRYTDYDKILTKIYNCSNTKEVYQLLKNGIDISQESVSANFEAQRTTFGKNLARVMKRVLVNKIMKEVEKCA